MSRDPFERMSRRQIIRAVILGILCGAVVTYGLYLLMQWAID